METFYQFCTKNPLPKDCSILFRFENITLTDVLPDLSFLPIEISVLNTRIELFIDEYNELSCVDKLESAENDCQAVLDWSWERLHIGIWSKVDVRYRILHSYHRLLESVLKCIRFKVTKDSKILDSLINILDSLDKALIMSPDLVFASSNLTLSSIANSLHKDLITEVFLSTDERFQSLKRRLKDEENEWKTNNDKISIPKMNSLNTIPRIDHSSLDLLGFQSEFLHKNIPVLITGAIDHWPAYKDPDHRPNWTLDTLLHRLAYRTVPIEIGSSYVEDDWSQKLMKFIDFVQQFCVDKPESVGYLAQYQLFQQIPDLAKDFSIPEYCAVTGSGKDKPSNIDINAWIGPAGTVSPLHTDPRDNIFVQVSGRKYVCLISPEVPPEQIYPLDSIQSNTSQVNLENVDPVMHSGFKQIDSKLVWETIVEAGEMLFIPVGWWHFVKSLRPSVSLSFWFD